MRYDAVIEYYKRCFEADSREGAIWDVTADKIMFRHFWTAAEAEFIRAEGWANLPPEIAKQVLSYVHTYRRERKLVVALGSVVGKIKYHNPLTQSATKKICAPLLTMEATLEPGEFTLRIDWENPQFNTQLIQQLIPEEYDARELNRLIDPRMLLNVKKLGDWLEQKGLDRRLYLNPGLIDPAEMARPYKDFFAKLLISDSLGLIFVERSKASRGIIDELNSLQDGREISRPLKIALGGNPPEVETEKWLDEISVPGILSAAQHDAIQNSRMSTVSTIVGPPGTGKSYTIASIVLDHFLNGKSALVVSRNEHAVGVVHKILVETFNISPNAISRTGEGGIRHNLIDQVEEIVKRWRVDTVDHKAPQPGDRLDELQVAVDKFEARCRNSMRYSRSWLEQESTGIGWWRRLLLRRFRRISLKRDTIFGMVRKIQDLNESAERFLALKINLNYQRNLNSLLKKDRSAFETLAKILRSRNSARQSKLFEHLNVHDLLYGMPIWLSSLDSLHRALPLESGIVDTVIFDEGTHCDMASAIPALQRGRKAVIVGDPKQLRHFSFLAKDEQIKIQADLNLRDIFPVLNYRDTSVVDLSLSLVARQIPKSFLDEHFRSLPHLISFSNKNFYKNSLRVMTEKPLEVQRSPIEIVTCSGKRIKGVNKVECERIIARVKALVSKQREFPSKDKLSIGILSFFSKQAELIQHALWQNFEFHSIVEHKLRSGTPYSFQGEERDIMLISGCIDDETPPGALTYMNRPDVFNVAVSRARELQILFTSFTHEKLEKRNFIRQYIDHAQEFRPTTGKSLKVSQKYTSELDEALSKLGLKVFHGAPIAGFPVDIVCTKGEFCFGIDIIGFPGDFESAIALERYKVLHRAGMKIVPVSLLEWIDRSQTFLSQIEKMLEEAEDQGLTEDNLLESLRGDWRKLGEFNVNFAKRMRVIEADLSSVDDQESMGQVGEAVAAFIAFRSIIDQKLSPGELTHRRYVQAVDHLMSGFMTNLEAIVTLWEALQGIGDDQGGGFSGKALVEQVTRIERIRASNEQAIQKLQNMVIEWSKVDTASRETAFERALDEVEALGKVVQSYSKK